MRLRTIEDAVAWIERVGIALLFPKPDVVLPSLWEAVADTTEVTWAIRDEAGGHFSFTPEMARVWSWKDELPKRRLACVGLHLARTSSLVAPSLVGCVYALTGRSGARDDFRDADLPELELELAEAALELGRPTTRTELRLLVGREKRLVDNAVNALQRKLVLTNAGTAERDSGWSATAHDLFARRWRTKLRALPTREQARRTLAERVLATAGDLSAADLAAALRLRRREAQEILEALGDAGRATRRDEDGIAVWRPR